MISPVNAADLTIAQLRNGKYLVPSWENPERGEWVQLKDGEFSRRNADDSLSVNIVKIARGHLSHDQAEDAAVIYSYNTGGSGIFLMLGAVLNDQGKPRNIASTGLGDRVKINSLTIQSGKIVIDLVTHGRHDPACCPTVKKVAAYVLVGNKLVEQ